MKFRKWFFKPILELIKVTKDELADKLDALDTRLGKAKTEILAEIQNLKDQIAGAGIGTNPRIDDAIARLESKVGELDDLNPDAPVPG